MNQNNVIQLLAAGFLVGFFAHLLMTEVRDARRYALDEFSDIRRDFYAIQEKVEAIGKPVDKPPQVIAE